MKNMLIKLIVTYFSERLKGKKAYIGAAGQMLTGVGSIITGIVGLIGSMYPDLDLPVMSGEAVWGYLTVGFYAVSSGFKSMGQRSATQEVINSLGEPNGRTDSK